MPKASVPHLANPPLRYNPALAGSVVLYGPARFCYAPGMNYPQPLLRGTLIRRYKRFLADVLLDDGAIVTAHCANTGSMLSLLEPDAIVWLSRSDNPKRKLQYTWELVTARGALVGINTSLPNKIVAASIASGAMPELSGYQTVRPEQKYGRNSRIDLLLQDSERPDCYVEIKSVTLSRQQGLAEFPDARTTRGQKHLKELSDVAAGGGRAVMLYLVQRDDCEQLALAKDLDPDYADGLADAQQAGVEVLCYACRVSPEGIYPVRKLELA